MAIYTAIFSRLMPVAEKSNTQPAQNIIPVSGTPGDKAASGPGETVVPNAAKTANLKTVPLFAPSSK